MPSMIFTHVVKRSISSIVVLGLHMIVLGYSTIKPINPAFACTACTLYYNNRPVCTRHKFYYFNISN